MSTIHFLNVLEGDCNIIQHDSKRVTVMDVSNAYNDYDTPEEIAVKQSQERKDRLQRTMVPSGKVDYKQKHTPDNPIEYLKRYGIQSIFRFIITHPDMDHIDGIRDLYEEFKIHNTWDTDNNKNISLDAYFGGYNQEDWKFYKNLRDGNFNDTARKTYYSGLNFSYFNEDYIKVLCPTPELVQKSNESPGNYHDGSYVLLYCPPKANGGHWKILLAGDSHDASWEHILKNYNAVVSNIDILFAPHHGRDSNRNYDFLKVLKPRVVLFGNASSKHLAYDAYRSTDLNRQTLRITNNQAGYVVIDINLEYFSIYVKNFDFARDFLNYRNWGQPNYSSKFNGYGLIQFNA